MTTADRWAWEDRQRYYASRVLEKGNGKPPWVFRIKMSWIIAMLSAAMVFVAIISTSGVGYWVASNSLMSNAALTLDDQSNSLLSDTKFLDSLRDPNMDHPLEVASRLHNPGLFMMVARPRHNAAKKDDLDIKPGSDLIALSPEDLKVVNGVSSVSQRREDNRLISTTQTGVNGWTLVLMQDLSALSTLTSHMAVVFSLLAGIGALIAMLAGWAVARTSLLPVQVLIDGTERIARTDDLTPLPVYGSDELAHLTESFNKMLAALQESRIRQSQLVADAGHELKTPLTSMRTNMELLLMVSRNPGGAISSEDISDLESDVMGQLEELTNLVTDLVDLAREDSHHTVVEPIDFGEIVDSVIDRVQRRRLDVAFQFDLMGWYLMGDQRGLSRAVLNVLDNAAKWSPPGGTVSMTMRQVDDALVQIIVDDEGPGIPPEERELVFERFYRSVESRAMPGSGLGLAIVKQVMQSHGGSVRVAESPYKGTRMILELPGGPNFDAEEDGPVSSGRS